MKKLLLFVLLLGGALFNEVSAGNPQNIPLQIINGSAAGNQSTKAPVRPLVITQDDYILTLPAQGNDHMLVLIVRGSVDGESTMQKISVR